jgi:hypothetical protein
MKFRLQSLKGDIAALVKELENGLRKLTPTDNFSGFTTTVTIPATSEARITNQLKSVPTGYIILEQTSGNNVVSKGDTPWTTNFLYITNNGSSEVTVKLHFIQ